MISTIDRLMFLNVY